MSRACLIPAPGRPQVPMQSLIISSHPAHCKGFTFSTLGLRQPHSKKRILRGLLTSLRWKWLPTLAIMNLLSPVLRLALPFIWPLFHEQIGSREARMSSVEHLCRWDQRKTTYDRPLTENPDLKTRDWVVTAIECEHLMPL